MRRESIYSGLQHRVQLSGYKMPVCEIHGSMVGMLCVDDSVPYSKWKLQVFDDIGVTNKGDNLDAVLSALFDKTRSDLVSEGFSFEPILPDDETSLVERTSALAQWCEGFLYGLGFNATQGEWTGDCGEILRDVVEISNVDSNVAGEADESSLFELVEYVRVAVQLLKAELQSGGNSVAIH